MNLNLRYFYLIGYICFGVIALMGFINLFVIQQNIFSLFSNIASTVFNIVLTITFFYLWRQENKQSNLPIEDPEIEDAIKNFQNDKYNKPKKKKEDNS